MEIAIWASVSIIFSFLCSMWEASLLSITPAFAEIKFQENTLFGKRLKSFKDNIDRPLSAILTLNTIAHTVGAIGVGAAATRAYPNNEMVTAIIVPVVMTLAILILSEIIPKTIGANSWKSLANFTVTSLHYIILALYPLVWFSQLITKFLKKDKSKSVLSRADFVAMAQIGAKTGSLRKDETKIIQNLLRFNTVLVKNVMTPRTVVKAANEEMTIREFYNDNNNLRFSRIPIYEKVKDKITGFVLKDEVLSSIIKEKGDMPLKEIERNILIISESMPIPDLFEKFMEAREHIALVVDEFGGTAGIVTMEDVIETLLGMEIMDEFDNIEDMQRQARINWERRAKDLGIIGENTSRENLQGNQETEIKIDKETTNPK